ncbi:MAG: chitosanase [Rhodoferax sp.]
MKRVRPIALLAGLCAVLLAACSAVVTPGEAGAAADARQREIEDRIVSAFENSTLVIQYAFIADINDGRGYTAGRSGFTSGTGDMLEVVKEYGVRAGGNVLERYLGALHKVNGSASLAGLEGIEQAWRQAASDLSFVAAQDAVNERLYRTPARQLATKLGARLPLSRLALYEAGIQHGHGQDYDSVNRIAERASAAAGGTPGKGADERRWLREFLRERRRALLSPASQPTAAGWAASVSRADAMQSIYDSGNFHLDQPLSITVYGDTFSIISAVGVAGAK